MLSNNGDDRQTAENVIIEGFRRLNHIRNGTQALSVMGSCVIMAPRPVHPSSAVSLRSVMQRLLSLGTLPFLSS